jgi:hypothetical protein
VTNDPWMGDNDADVAAGGNVPSPAPRWLSPDIWNRRAPVTTDACIPRIPPPNVMTVGGVTRDCGSSLDHENPVSGTTNFLYATLRNTRPGAVRNAYVEVAVYIASASTGLAWPTDFTLLPESRQFISVHLEPGQVTDIGPLPWVPPSPAPSDHFCLYVRVLSVQETAAVEGVSVDANVGGSNSLGWRNVNVVPPGTNRKVSTFIVRNIRERTERIALQIDIPQSLFATGSVTLRPDAALAKALAAADTKLDGVTAKGQDLFVITAPTARIDGFSLAPRQGGTLRLELAGQTAADAAGDIVVSQFSSQGTDGGVVLRVGRPKQ